MLTPLRKENPTLFMEIAKDEDIKLRNLANRSVEMGIVKSSERQY